MLAFLKFLSAPFTQASNPQIVVYIYVVQLYCISGVICLHIYRYLMWQVKWNLMLSLIERITASLFSNYGLRTMIFAGQVFSLFCFNSKKPININVAMKCDYMLCSISSSIISKFFSKYTKLSVSCVQSLLSIVAFAMEFVKLNILSGFLQCHLPLLQRD